MTKFEELTPAEIRRHRETVLLRLLVRTSQAETAELVAELHRRGHRDVQPGYIGFLGNIDTEGTRLVEVARRVGVSRQAVSQSVRDIEDRGYLERLRDPTDGRAVIVRHTRKGRKLLADALEIMAEIERGYESLLGARRMKELKATLATLADAVDPRSRFTP